ncbi:MULTISPECIES: shikimate dehydrogenase family protein [Maritimibacter]|jgi:shikimate dehydrogenase|uniref:shikimate dehydrogenase (NADP(+)) n=1 Tax=Maritimibacter alkaliphilus HTCC2654 TaxID=314271 RepID=A3VD62_9RHOB|nr:MULTISPECIES: shikimate dehydrogenase [Maritimibacter]EAQ14091.1 shikimate 5-dehydrogenase [Maritimibacter alkaliphilus HTCC2654]MBL6427956.1 shikimate dehydrogenase [Maritimibacter sp.]TYP84284.1 shikimate dehydrogenase [Maritimibacter alkaliphilus HTCC2654]
MSEASTPIAAVMLAPGETSRLPVLFDHWLWATQLPGRYLPLTVEPQDIGDVISALPKAGFVGLHISAAYQKAVLDHADIITDRAALMSGANTLIFRRDGKIHADNTDGYGFIENIRLSVPGWDARLGPAAIFGAGRAARVVISALIEVGVGQIRLTSRTRPKAEQLRSEFGTRIEVVDWLKAGNMAEGAATVVNATPLGTRGNSDFRVPLDGLTPGAVACDLTVDPPATRFLQQAAAYGCHVADGVGMLICQASPSFERWFGQRPPNDEDARIAAAS